MVVVVGEYFVLFSTYDSLLRNMCKYRCSYDRWSIIGLSINRLVRTNTPAKDHMTPVQGDGMSFVGEKYWHSMRRLRTESR